MGFNFLGSSAENRNQTTTNNISGGAADSAQSIVASNSEVNLLDEGAIKSSFDFAKQSQAFFGENLVSVLGLAKESVQSQGDLIEQINKSETNRQTLGASNLAPLVIVGSVITLIAYRIWK